MESIRCEAMDNVHSTNIANIMVEGWCHEKTENHQFNQNA